MFWANRLGNENENGILPEAVPDNLDNPIVGKTDCSSHLAPGLPRAMPGCQDSGQGNYHLGGEVCIGVAHDEVDNPLIPVNSQ